MQIRQTSYLRKALMPGEEALLEAQLHWTCYLQVWMLLLIGIATAAIFIFAAPIFFLWAFYNYLKVSGVQLLVTNKRVVFKEGILSVHTEEIRNAKVESIEIRQSIMGSILGYATIHFAGTGNSDVYFVDVADPWTVKNQAEYIINDEK